MIYNLGILLSNDCTWKENHKDVLLPTEEDVLSMLNSKPCNDQVNTRESQYFSDKSETVIASNELCATIRDHRGKLNWFLGYFMKINENSIKNEHLERVLANNNLSWRYPNYADIQEIEDKQILPIKVVSEWDYSNTENFALVVKNAVEIDSCFSKYTSEEH